MVWGFVEQGVAFIAACLPTLKPVVSKSSLGSILRSIRSIFFVLVVICPRIRIGELELNAVRRPSYFNRAACSVPSSRKRPRYFRCSLSSEFFEGMTQVCHIRVQIWWNCSCLAVPGLRRSTTKQCFFKISTSKHALSVSSLAKLGFSD